VLKINYQCIELLFYTSGTDEYIMCLFPSKIQYGRTIQRNSVYKLVTCSKDIIYQIALSSALCPCVCFILLQFCLRLSVYVFCLAL
jgi:hypothetical protein